MDEDCPRVGESSSMSDIRLPEEYPETLHDRVEGDWRMTVSSSMPMSAIRPLSIPSAMLLLMIVINLRF